MSGNVPQLKSVKTHGNSEGSFVAPKVGGTDGGNGGMDDVLKRLGNVERDVSETRADVARIEAHVSHLATREDLQNAMNGATTKFIGWMFAVFSLFTVLMGGLMTILKFFSAPSP